MGFSGQSFPKVHAVAIGYCEVPHDPHLRSGTHESPYSQWLHPQTGKCSSPCWSGSKSFRRCKLKPRTSVLIISDRLGNRRARLPAEAAAAGEAIAMEQRAYESASTRASRRSVMLRTPTLTS